jgi:hypothetical protein
MKEVGDVVKYTDHRGVQHLALITAVWSETTLNLVYVSKDATEHDDYGNQIKRETSVYVKTPSSAPGNFWE